MDRKPPIFETTNADLASYLIYSGVKLLEFKNSDVNKRIIIIRFLDEKHNCLDLEHNFLRSEFKKYRDINKHLLKQIHIANKDGI